MLTGYIVTCHMKITNWSNQEALWAHNYLHFKILKK